MSFKEIFSENLLEIHVFQFTKNVYSFEAQTQKLWPKNKFARNV